MSFIIETDVVCFENLLLIGSSNLLTGFPLISGVTNCYFANLFLNIAVLFLILPDPFFKIVTSFKYGEFCLTFINTSTPQYLKINLNDASKEFLFLLPTHKP